MHCLHVSEQEWIEVLGQHQLTNVVRPQEVVIIVVFDFLLHVCLQTLRVSFDDLINNIVQLHDLTTERAYEMFLAIEAVVLNEIGFQDLNCLSLEDDVSLDLVSVLLQFQVLGTDLPCQTPVFLPLDFGFFSFNLVNFGLFNVCISFLDDILVNSLSIIDAKLYYFARSLDGSLILMQKINNLIEKPRQHLLLNMLDLWSDNYTLAGQFLNGLLSNSRKVVFGEATGCYLLMSTLLLFLSCSILDLAPLNLFLISLFRGLVPLSDN